MGHLSLDPSTWDAGEVAGYLQRDEQPIEHTPPG